MKTLYFECKMGAAGDMLMAALYELLEDKEGFLSVMNSLFPSVTVRALPASSCGIAGTRMEVLVGGREELSEDADSHGYSPEPTGQAHSHDHGHDLDREHEHGHDHDHDCGHDHDHDHDHGHGHVHHTPADVQALMDTLPLPEEVRRQAQEVYRRIAQAEAEAHGRPVEQIHFHEVGELDAVTDVAGVCYALYLLRPERVCASPVHLGSGQVRCAHGVVPVPAPATARLMRGVPCYTGDIPGELCTPTGAALLAHFARSFGPMPPLRLQNTGYGMGKKKFAAANCVRAFWGDADDAAVREIVELRCHIDDMTAEALAFAGERLLEQGALDISSTPMTMKKGRAGVSFLVLCQAGDEQRLARAMLRETSTNGVRAQRCRKYILTPSIRSQSTPYGPVRIKCADGEGIHREKPEYEDVAEISRRTGRPFGEIWLELLRELSGHDGGGEP